MLGTCVTPYETDHELVIVTKHNHLRDTKHTIYIFSQSLKDFWQKREACKGENTLLCISYEG